MLLLILNQYSTNINTTTKLILILTLLISSKLLQKIIVVLRLEVRTRLSQD